MEFNTAPVWSLISLLILITIGIIVWYFYNEINFIKIKLNWLEGRTEETFSQFYKKLYELQSINEVEYEENEDSEEEDEDLQSLEEILEEEEEEENHEENPDEKEEEEEEEEEEEFESEHPSITEVIEVNETSEGCDHVMLAGKRKGQYCGKSTKEGNKCSVHC